MKFNPLEDLDSMTVKIARVARDVLTNCVTPATVELAREIEPWVDVDFILVVAGASLENLGEARELALEELEAL